MPIKRNNLDKKLNPAQHTPMDIISISGPDAIPFLQRQATCDINALTERPIMAACCNQKGRMVANFWIWKDDNTLLLALPTSMTITLMNHLKKYALFSKVTFSKIDTPLPKFNMALTPIWILPATSSQFTPQMINLQKYGGVSFTKGCYLGQEIIARTEHLGRLKRHLYQLKKVDSRTFEIGMPIYNEKQQKVGTLVTISKEAIFAVILDEAAKKPLYLDGLKMTLQEDHEDKR